MDFKIAMVLPKGTTPESAEAAELARKNAEQVLSGMFAETRTEEREKICKAMEARVAELDPFGLTTPSKSSLSIRLPLPPDEPLARADELRTWVAVLRTTKG